MAYVLPGSKSMKASLILCKVRRLPDRLSISTIKKNLTRTLTPFKKSNAAKPFTQIVAPEKKPIHGRSSIPKNYSLPYLKQNNGESKQNSSLMKQETHLSISSEVNLPEKLSKSQIIHKNQSEDQPIIEVKIQVIKVKDTKMKPKKNLSNDFESSEENLTPTLLITSATSSKSNQHSNLSILPLNPISSYRKNADLDLFYYKSILSHSNFSTFHSILDGLMDLRLNIFPYYKAVLQTSNKVKPIVKNVVVRAPKAYHECSCKNQTILNGNSWYLRIRDLNKAVPWVQPVYVSSQASRYKKNLVLINYSGVFGKFFSDLNAKPRTVSCVKKLSKSFKIILIHENPAEHYENLINRFRDLEIPISGVYEVNFPHSSSRELSKMLDYSKIYQDFCVVSPEKQVLIITSHKISDVHQANVHDFIATKKLSYKLNIERPPVHSEEYSLTPLTVLLPNYLLSENPGPLNKIIRQVTVLRKIEAVYDSLHFKVLLSHNQSNKVANSVVYQILLEEVKGKAENQRKSGGFCKLHRKLVNYNEKYLETLYLI